MIIKRLAEGIRRQDWFVVTVEILIVVVGIFIGLQVDDWNKARQDRILERQYLERLYADLNGTLEDFYENVVWDKDRLITQQFVLETLRSGTLDPERRHDFETGLAYAGTHNPIRGRWGTFEELISTGNIALITDIEVRDTISRLRGDFERSQQIISRSLTISWNLREGLSPHFDILSFSYGQNSTAVELVYDFEALVNNPEIKNSLSTLQMNSDIVVSFVVGHMHDVLAFRDMLGRKLGKDMRDAPRLDFFATDLYDRPLPNNTRPIQ